MNNGWALSVPHFVKGIAVKEEEKSGERVRGGKGRCKRIAKQPPILKTS